MKRQLVVTSLIIVALAGGPARTQQPSCETWGGDSSLSGFLVSGAFPGPPEFTSIAGGDEPLSALLLYLDQPICIDRSDAGDPMIAATELVQLACTKGQLAGRSEGESITLRGELYPAHTGYHRTPALLACVD